MEGDDGLPAQSLWLLVSHISIHFEDPITRLGINIVDSPEITDFNRHDQAIKKEIQMMKAKGLGRVVIVLPKTDKIGDTTTVEGSKRNKERVKRLKEKVVKLEHDLNATDCQIAAATSDSARGALATRGKRLEVLVKLAQNDVDAQRIRMRSGSMGATTKIAKPKVGWPKYRKSYFKQVVCKPQGLWMEACDRAEADLIEALHREKQAVTASIGAVFQDYLSAFDTMCAAKANDDPAEMQLREHLKKNLQLGKAHWDKPMHEAVDSLTKNF